MRTPATILAGAALLAVAMGAGWWKFRPLLAPQIAAATTTTGLDGADGDPLPLPPVPPRIDEGTKYDSCLSMLGTDPSGAVVFADGWLANGGKDGALHCRALAQVALGSPDVGAAQLEQLAAASAAPAVARASIYGQAAQAWMMATDPAHALADGDKALALSPDDPDLLIAHAIAAAALDRFKDVVADLNTALQLEPRRPDALVARAVAWRHLNRLDRAQDDLERAFAIDPDNPEALLERGIVRERQGNRDGAESDWARTIDLSPDSAAADLAQQNLALLEAGPDKR